MSQSDTRTGDFRCLAGEDLTGMEGRVLKLTHDGGVAEAVLPSDNGDYALWVLLNGAVDGENVDVRPLAPCRNVRLKLKGACNPGDVLVPADVGTAGDRGMVRALPADAGTYRGLCVAEEAGVDGQLVLARPALIGLVTVAG